VCGSGAHQLGYKAVVSILPFWACRKAAWGDWVWVMVPRDLELLKLHDPRDFRELHNLKDLKYLLEHSKKLLKSTSRDVKNLISTTNFKV
jgi:hypothetical protein